ncbi:hypothetical protein KIL84_002681 [Mauremys mutica]|uniref:Uncharacterized protein n=1 Tax=Mauremys mutica TaxID=74926 RepID=A0A9D3WTS2_9SAUR|nr:hypothetical protein KIL84_002681 [Mauremys mutica]
MGFLLLLTSGKGETEGKTRPNISTSAKKLRGSLKSHSTSINSVMNPGHVPPEAHCAYAKKFSQFFGRVLEKLQCLKGIKWKFVQYFHHLISLNPFRTCLEC